MGTATGMLVQQYKAIMLVGCSCKIHCFADAMKLTDMTTGLESR